MESALLKGVTHFLLIVALVGIGKSLTEPGGKGRLLVSNVQMRNIAKGTHTEAGDAFSALFCVDSCDRCGRSAGIMPWEKYASSG